jgi:hypothetical protein
MRKIAELSVKETAMKIIKKDKPSYFPETLPKLDFQ